MDATRRAVIDIGTNSVKLLVADVARSGIDPVLETSRQTRLGAGFYPAHVLQPERIAATADAVTQFAHQARSLRAAKIRVIATSAVRDAANQQDLVRAVEGRSSLKVEVISGEQEADLAFHGATTAGRYAAHPLLLVEVGGGSTQFLLGHSGHVHFRQSYPLGTVRLMEQAPHSDPPAAHELTRCRDFLRTLLHREIEPKVRSAMDREVQSLAKGIIFLSTGGTASILAAMEARLTHFNRAIIEKTVLTLARLRWHEAHLWSLSLAERQNIPGLPPNRADVILPGASIYFAICELFGFQELRVSTRGLRFAALLDGEAHK